MAIEVRKDGRGYVLACSICGREIPMSSDIPHPEGDYFCDPCKWALAEIRTAEHRARVQAWVDDHGMPSWIEPRRKPSPWDKYQ